VQKFSFSLSEQLHRKLKRTALEQGVSVSAICREALASHLYRQKLDVQSNIEDILNELDTPDRISTSWRALKSQVWSFLDASIDKRSLFSSSGIPGVPGFDDPSELLGHRPKKQRFPLNSFGARPLKPFQSSFDHVRFLDEIWA